MTTPLEGSIKETIQAPYRFMSDKILRMERELRTELAKIDTLTDQRKQSRNRVKQLRMKLDSWEETLATFRPACGSEVPTAGNTEFPNGEEVPFSSVGNEVQGPLGMKLDDAEWSTGGLKRSFTAAAKRAGWSETAVSTMRDVLDKAPSVEAMKETLRPHTQTARPNVFEPVGEPNAPETPETTAPEPQATTDRQEQIPL